MRTRARQFAVLLCILALLFAAFTAPVTGVMPAMIAPVWLFLFFVAAISIQPDADPVEQLLRPLLPIVASRPPPSV